MAKVVSSSISARPICIPQKGMGPVTCIVQGPQAIRDYVRDDTNLANIFTQSMLRLENCNFTLESE